MSSNAETRRWIRQQVDLPVSVRCVANMSVPVCGRATEISEGGMAVYAGVDLKPNELMQVEFQAPSQTQVTGIVRNRSGYCFGLEFLTPLPVGMEDQSRSRGKSTATPKANDAPVLTSEAIRQNEARMAKGSAVAYLVLARVLQNAGKPDEARKALERGLVYLAESRNANLKAKELEMKRLRDQIEVLRSVAPVLQESQSRGALDARIAGILRALPKVLERKNK